MILKKIYNELLLIRKELQVIRNHLESMNFTTQELKKSSSRQGTTKLLI